MMPHVVKQKSCCCSSSWRRKWVSFWWQSKLCKIKYSVHLWNRLQEEEEIFFIRNLTRQMSYTIEFPLPPPQKKKSITQTFNSAAMQTWFISSKPKKEKKKGN
jgi:hypothetical protein